MTKTKPVSPDDAGDEFTECSISKLESDLSDENKLIMKKVRTLSRSTFKKKYAKYVKEFPNKATSYQKTAVADTLEEVIRKYPHFPADLVWRYIMEQYVQSKGVLDLETYEMVISVSNSWKKSGGHGFEELVKRGCNNALEGTDLSVVLQKDLTTLIRKKKLSNVKAELTWLSEKKTKETFDQYLLQKDGETGNFICIGVIQSKVSIRDRVTRDREPSISAMNEHFWSIVFVLDGGYIKTGERQKFVDMVNGNGGDNDEYEKNGWHGMYVFSNAPDMSGVANNRIYPEDITTFGMFKGHALQAKSQFNSDRLRFKPSWIAKEPDIEKE